MFKKIIASIVLGFSALVAVAEPVAVSVNPNNSNQFVTLFDDKRDCEGDSLFCYLHGQR